MIAEREIAGLAERASVVLCEVAGGTPKILARGLK